MEKPFPIIVYPTAISLLVMFLGLVWYVMPADLLSHSVETISRIVTSNPNLSTPKVDCCALYSSNILDIFFLF